MSPQEVLSQYSDCLAQLQATVDHEAWEQLTPILDAIDDLQRTFDQFSPGLKRQPDVQRALRRLHERHAQCMQQLTASKQRVESRLRQLKTAKIQQKGYSQVEHVYVPAAFYDQRK